MSIQDEVQTELLEELRAQLLAATGDKPGGHSVLQPAEPSAAVARLQKQEAALRAELSKAEYASARQAAQLLELQGTAEQHARTAAELAQAQGALKAQLSKQVSPSLTSLALAVLGVLIGALQVFSSKPAVSHGPAELEGASCTDMVCQLCCSAPP